MKHGHMLVNNSAKYFYNILTYSLVTARTQTSWEPGGQTDKSQFKYRHVCMDEYMLLDVIKSQNKTRQYRFCANIILCIKSVSITFK